MDLVFHLTKCSEGSMVSSARLSRFIAETLNLPLIDNIEAGEEILLRTRRETLNKFLLVNSPTGFAEPRMRELCAALSYVAKDPIYVQNDYKMKPPSQCKSYCLNNYLDYRGESSEFYGMRLWSTVPKVSREVFIDYINWNTLTYNPQKYKSHSLRNGGFVYWGALRPGREDRLQKYLDGLDVTISTAPQSFKKFQKWIPNANYVKQFKTLIPELCNFKATLYTQDKMSDRMYCSLANRFYESLSAGLAMFIDEKSVNTFKEANLKGYEDFVVTDSTDISLMLDDTQAIADRQKELWVSDYRSELIYNLRRLYNDA